MAKFSTPVNRPADEVAVAIYIRASDPRVAKFAPDGRRATAARQENTLPLQRSTCEAYAAARGWAVAGVWQDGESGFNDDRAGYRAMLADKTWNTLLVWKTDRLGRDTAELFSVAKQIRKAGRRLVSATQNVDDPMIMGFHFLLAEQESRLKSERVTPVMIALAASGRYCTRPTHGYQLIDGEPKIRPVPAARILRAGRQFLAGHASARQIVADWNRRGVPSPTGGVWHHSALIDILRSPTYAGLIAWPGLPEPVPGRHTALFTREEWQAIQARLDVGARAWSRVTSRHAASLLSGFGTCACGAALIHHRSGPPTRPVTYLACRARLASGACAIPGMLRMDSVEAAVGWVLAPILTGDAATLRAHYGAATVVEYDATAEAVSRSRARVQAELAKAVRQLSGLINMRAADEIDADSYKEKRAEFMQAKADAEATLALMPEDDGPVADPDPAATAARLTMLAAVLATGDAATRLANGRDLLEVLGVALRRDADGLWVRVAPAWRRWTRGDTYFRLDPAAGRRVRPGARPATLYVPSGDDGSPYAPERTCVHAIAEASSFAPPAPRAGPLASVVVRA